MGKKYEDWIGTFHMKESKKKNGNNEMGGIAISGDKNELFEKCGTFRNTIHEKFINHSVLCHV